MRVKRFRALLVDKDEAIKISKLSVELGASQEVESINGVRSERTGSMEKKKMMMECDVMTRMKVYDIAAMCLYQEYR